MGCIVAPGPKVISLLLVGAGQRSLGSTLTRTCPTGGFRSGHSEPRAFLSLVTPSLDPELKTLGLPWSALQVASFVTRYPYHHGRLYCLRDSAGWA